jgi:ATP-dependent Lon protease
MTEQPKPIGSPRELSPEELRWTCDPKLLDFEDTSHLPATHEIIGQERALRSISLGLALKSPGYNIFVAGFVGTGRNTTIQRVLSDLDRGVEPPDDLCYVYNFARNDRPRALFVPAGKGRRLSRRMDVLVARLLREIPQTFESEAYRKRRERVEASFKTRQRKLIEAFDKKARTQDFALVQVQVGPVASPEVVPVVDGEPKFFPDLEEAAEEGKLPRKKLEAIRERHQQLSSELHSVIKETMNVESEMAARLSELDHDVARPIVTANIDIIREAFAGLPAVLEYLDAVERHCLDHLDQFLPAASRDPSPAHPQGAPDPDWCLEYRVNLVVDNSDAKGAPVVVENNPTAPALFGIIERHFARNGDESVDHMKIKGGSLLAANGGYLVLNASDLFHEPVSVWNSLKRALRTGRHEIPSMEPFSMLGPAALKPEPVEVNVKVVLIGDAHLYSLLWAYDEEFKKIFKVRADFDTEMENTPENVKLYGSFVQRLVTEEAVLPFDREGLAELVEYGSRVTGRRDKLSTRFNLIADLIREASYFASGDGARTASARHVARALEEKVYRNNLVEEKMQELIREGSVFIDVQGAKVGSVNGLAIYESGEHAFGLPSRITASVSMGNAGIINIEREAELSGHVHDKGVQILAGYLRSKYAQDKPLTLSASICFEQSYSGVDGDSASSTELYALLSALAELPVRQDLAVTGSVNQQGEIQPIGGVNEKIEGFFDICRAKGLTKTQGVLIPSANLPDLMLHPRVVESVRKGEFHIYSVATIDAGIEILTGLPAGAKEGKRRYPANTVNGKIDLRLARLALQMREYGGGHS